MQKILTVLMTLLVIAATAQTTTQNPNANAGSHATTGLKVNTTGKKPKKPATKMTKANTPKTPTKTTTTGVQGHIMNNGNTGTTGSTGSNGSNNGGWPTPGNGGTTSTPSNTGNNGGWPTPGNTGGNSNNGGGSTGGGGDILPADAVNAIKQALITGITTGVSKVSVTDGYFGNPAIKIPLPQEIEMVDEGLRMVGAGEYVDKLVLQINRSAEQSAVQATPIFVNAITKLSITDAVNIVSGQQPDAATQFLKRTTTDELVMSFKPTVKSVLDKTYTTDIWNTVMGYYNKIPFVSPVNTDLSDYVTRKALDGLFYMVAQEEAKIRKDPAGQASGILTKVFGKVLSLKAKN